MKKKFLLVGALLFASAYFAQAQDTTKATPASADPGLTIFGSVDTYYKYDFAGRKNANIATSFILYLCIISFSVVVRRSSK